MKTCQACGAHGHRRAEFCGRCGGPLTSTAGLGPGGARRSRTSALVAVLVCGVLAALVGVGWVLVGRGRVVASAPAARIVTSVAQPAAQPATPTIPPVVTHGGQECGRYGSGAYSAVGTDNATTSCAFAINVRNAYLAARLSGAPGRVMAYSPTTRQDYEMTCSGSEPVLCTGGVAARVLIYGGQLQ